MFIYTGQKKLRIIFLNCFQNKYECNFDHLFSPYFLPYVYNTVMLPVGPCISWVNDYTNEYWYRVKNKVFQRVYRIDCHVYWKTFVKFSIIVDILLTFHMMRRHLTGNEAAQAVGMIQAGQVQRAVAGQFNISQSVISRLWNGFQHTGNVAERPRSGRPRKTTMRQDRYLSNMAKRQRFQCAVRLNSDFRTATGVCVSSQTVHLLFYVGKIKHRSPPLGWELSECLVNGIWPAIFKDWRWTENNYYAFGISTFHCWHETCMTYYMNPAFHIVSMVSTI
jgi:transposase